MRVTDKYIFFWDGFPSNWYPSPFTITYNGKELQFQNSEQYFMWVKAITFNDNETADKILKEGNNPKTAKKLGREVKNYDDNVWNEKRYQVMVDANYYKYSQNKELKELLLNKEFEGKHYVEASPYDGIWGIKCGETEALDDKSNWNGHNLLGKALDEVRERLLKKDKKNIWKLKLLDIIW